MRAQSEIGARLAGGRQLRDDLTDFLDHGMIHLAVEQHAAALGDQVFCPEADQHGAEQADGRIQPGPAVEPAAGEGDDGEHRGQGVGDDVDVGRFQVEVMVMVVAVAMSMSMGMVVPVMVIVGLAENQRADEIDRQAEGGDRIASG